MEVQAGVTAVRGALAARLPDQPVRSVLLLGAGTDNIAYEVNGELVVRFSRSADPRRRAAQVRHDRHLLELAGRLCPVPVPRPVFTIAEQGCLAYRRVPGVPLLDLPPARRAGLAGSVATVLAEVLAALHATPLDRVAGLVAPDASPLTQWRDEAVGTWPTVVHAVPAAYRPVVEDFLHAPPPSGEHRPVFAHNDLGIEHVLVDPVSGTVTGVIDWSDAAITDPAHDVGLLYRDLGPQALEVVLRRCCADPTERARLRARAVFHARCGLLEDLAYGLEAGDARYIDKSRAGLTWLFPPPPAGRSTPPPPAGRG